MGARVMPLNITGLLLHMFEQSATFATIRSVPVTENLEDPPFRQPGLAIPIAMWQSLSLYGLSVAGLQDALLML